MKKLIIILILIYFIIIAIMQNVYAKNDTYTLEMQIINNKNEDVNLYILLPKQYILYAMEYDNYILVKNYNGPNILMEEDIPSIKVNKKNVQSEVYEEKGIEYVQILLEKNENNIYEFDILTNYKSMDIKYRIKNEDKDFIMHIDGFKVENDKCEIIYDYENETVKQPNKIVMTTATKFLIFLLIIIITLGIISYFKQRR